SRNETQPISGIVAAHEWEARRSAIAAIDTMTESVGGEVPTHRAAVAGESLAEFEREQAEAAGRLASVLAARGAPESGLLVVNPHSFARRSLIDISSLGVLPAVAGAVKAAQETAGKKFALVEA